jgi:hypothetical protein
LICSNSWSRAGAVAGIDIADHIELALSSQASHAAIGIASGSSPFRPYIIRCPPLKTAGL